MTPARAAHAWVRELARMRAGQSAAVVVKCLPRSKPEAEFKPGSRMRSEATRRAVTEEVLRDHGPTPKAEQVPVPKQTHAAVSNAHSEKMVMDFWEAVEAAKEARRKALPSVL